MSRRQASFALRPWPFVALALASCMQAHGRPEPAEPDVELDGSIRGDEPDATEPEALVEPSCLIADSFVEALRAACPDPSLDQTPCGASDADCVRYQRDSPNSPPFGICSATCRPGAAGGVWSIGCYAQCNRECPAPAADVTVVHLDTSDCEARPLVPCRDDFLLQNQLDATLRGLVQDRAVSLLEVPEDALIVHFEHGCPSSFHAVRHRDIPMIEAALTLPLGRVRLACAVDLACGEILGPSTIAGQ